TIAKFAAFDKAGAADASARLDAYVEQLKAVEANKVVLDEVKRLDKDLTDAQTLRTSKIERENALYEAGKITREELLSNVAAINSEMDTGIATAAENLKSFAEAHASVMSAVDLAAVQTRADTALAQ